MSHHGHGGALGVFAIVAAIAYAFGNTAARVVVGSVLIAGGLFLTYIMFLIATVGI